MSCDEIRCLIDSYAEIYSDERASTRRFHELLEDYPNCFERACFTPGHLTGSAWVVDGKGARTLLTHHRKAGCNSGDIVTGILILLGLPHGRRERSRGSMGWSWFLMVCSILISTRSRRGKGIRRTYITTCVSLSGLLVLRTTRSLGSRTIWPGSRWNASRSTRQRSRCCVWCASGSGGRGQKVETRGSSGTN